MLLGYGKFNHLTTQAMNVMKLAFLRTLYEWMATISGHSFSSLLEFLGLCTFT